MGNMSHHMKSFKNSALNTISILMLLIISSTLGHVVPEETSSTCNNCCQGPGGLPGIPGVPGSAGPLGSPGHLGSPGPKGDQGESGMSVKGEKGDVGEMGLPGTEGSQGELGLRGLPGKVGPVGIQGPSGQNGVDGTPGRLGEKGEKGVAGESSFAGFTVRKTSPQSTTSGIPVTFDTVITDTDGNYDTDSNKFTCQIPGYYFFTFTIGARESNYPYATLVKNGVYIVDAYIHPASTYAGHSATSTNSALLNLVSGDEVWIWNRHAYQDIYAATGSYAWTTFSGVLLHAT